MNPSKNENGISTSLNAIYSRMAVDATYTSASGSAKSVSVLVDDRTKDRQDKSGGRVLVERLVGSVRVSEVSSLGRATRSRSAEKRRSSKSSPVLSLMTDLSLISKPFLKPRFSLATSPECQ